VLHAERFWDQAPASVYATLLDEGVYLASIATMYRLLRAAGETGDRRRHATHPARVKPELLASGPNQCWSWDITKLHGPAKWTWYYLYVLLDIYSRYAVGWMVAHREAAALAERLLADAIAAQHVEPVQPGHRVVERPEDPRARREPGPDLGRVLDGLEAEEDEAAEDREGEVQAQGTDVAALRRHERLDDGVARREQHDRVDGGKRDAQVVRGLRPAGPAEAEHDVGGDQPAEHHDLGREEPPHRHLPRRDLAGNSLGLDTDDHRALSYRVRATGTRSWGTQSSRSPGTLYS